jgi:hypothetical protein
MEQEFFEQRTDLSRLNSAVEQIKTNLGKIGVGQHSRWAHIDRRCTRHSQNAYGQIDSQEYKR